MRKYDSKNKINIGIIVGLCIVFAIIFSYFLIKEIKLSKIKYELEAKTLVFDVDKNAILLNDIGTVKKKWNKKYYLTYNEEQYQIGSHVIAFNNNELSLTLYGEFYEVNRSSEITITKEETKLNNLSISRFYKIADRKYLIVDSLIKSEDSSLETTNYLIIELDKLGNAILYNNSLNLKTFSETKLITSTYTFDIANELLIYEDATVDLKKILGTTNEYKPKEEENNDETGTGTGNGASGGTGGNQSGNGGAGTGSGTGAGSGGTGDGGGGTSGGNIVTDENGEDITDSEIINQTATTSIIRITPGISNINVDYVIYDTIGKYLSTFIEVKGSNFNNVVYLSKGATNASVANLNPGTEYTLTFKYTYMDNDSLKEEVIDTHKVTTLLPNITLTGTRVTSNKIEYKITVDNSYEMTSAKLKIYLENNKKVYEESIDSEKLVGELDISNISFNKNPIIVTLSLEDIYINGVKIDKTVKWSYRRDVTNIFAAKPEEGEGNEE